MSLGESILGLLGTKDPRTALLQAAMGASGVQYAGGAGGGAGAAAPAAAGGAGAQAPQAAQQPEAYKSPEELTKMYQDLVNYNSRVQNIDRGIGMIGASLAQEENRKNIMEAFGGGSGPTNVDPSSIAELAVNMQKQQQAAKSRAAMLASLPTIADRYGMDLETAKYLFDSGQLDDVIKEKEKGGVVTATDGTGRVIVIGKNDGRQIGTLGQPKDESQVRNGPNGSIVRVGSGPNATVETLMPGDTSTTDTREYEYYLSDERTAGRTPMSFSEWQTKKAASGADKTEINTTEQTSFDKKVGEKYGEKYVSIMNGADSALTELDQYNVLEQALNTGIRTGFAGEAELALQKAGVAAGLLDPNEKIAAGETIQKMSNKMALAMRNPESGMGMPGSLSDKDLVFLKDSQIGLSTSPEGNKVALEVFRRMARRRLDLADLAEEYVAKHKTMSGFNRVVRKFAEENPLFADLNIPKQAGFSDSPAAPGGATPSIDDLVKKHLKVGQ